MKPITIAVGAVVLVLQATVAPPPEAHAQGVVRTDRRCRATLARASRRNFDQTMIARQECERRRIQRRIPDSIDCLAPINEMQDERTAAALERATTRLSQDLAAGCTGVDLDALGFPGICGPNDDGSDFDIFNLFECAVETNGIVVDELLHINFPSFDGFFGQGAARCVKAVNDRARRMVTRELRARQICMLQEQKGRFGIGSEVDCREPIPPYGIGTKDSRTDAAVVAAYRALLTKVPSGCAAANVRGLYGGNGCPDSTGGGFNVFDLQVCVFESHRAADPPLMELSFPSPPACGNGTVEGIEQCDDGDANSLSGPCLPDCTRAACSDGNVCSAPACGTGPGGGVEQCDDGNQNDNDPCRSNCANAACGDGAVCNAPGCTTGPGGGVEQCDTGSNDDQGPCLATCTVAVCGDGEVCTDLDCTSGPDGGPEACDGGGESRDCNADCSPSLCGDGTVNVTDGEECDDGFANNTGAPNACRPDCTLPECGDGVIDDRFGEECDPPDGNTCDENCRSVAPASCGDGILNGPCTGDAGILCTSDADCAGAGICDLEECDDGAGNSNTTPNACRVDCVQPVCGDGVIDDQRGEACDDGGANANNAPCLATCQPATCGDANTCTAAACTTGPGGGPEQCDAGAGNSDSAPDACRTNCASASCGDGVPDSGEQCDDGAGNSDTAPDSCRTDCNDAGCGDDVVDSGEECDNGGANADNADCLGNCTDALCGDGLTCTAGDCTSGPGGGAEQCDDASNNGNSRPCLDNCAAAACGDDVICSDSACTTGPGGGPEQCDEGAANGDGCTTQCGCDVGATVPGCLEVRCPDRGSLVIYAGTTSIECSSNADCPVPSDAGGLCNTDIGRCQTETDLDTGWQGIAHDADITDQIRLNGSLSCPGPFDPSSDQPCGECEVTGTLPDTRNCRCSNNIRDVCDDTFALDTDDCTVEGVSCTVDDDCRVCNESTDISCVVDSDCPDGEFCQTGLALPSCVDNQCVGTCNCYFGPPLALSSANTPACVVNRFANDVSGTANVDLGAGVITANLRSVVYLGELITVPCPVCAGSCTAPAASAGLSCLFGQDCDVAGGDGVCGNFDTVAGDGVREGTCFLGQTIGKPCDIDAFNETFPFPGGGGHSLDCPPNNGKNVSGQGLKIDLAQTTEDSQLEADVPCGFSFLPAFCQCGVCAGTSDPCSGDEDCPGSTCGRRAQGDPQPNSCGSAPCIQDPSKGGNNGICDGVEVQFCDGALRANGEPFVNCLSDADCAGSDCGLGDCGLCTLRRSRQCFLPTIMSVGRPDPEFPLGATVFCIGPTSSQAINSAAGLPGPGRVVNQARSATFCASDPSIEYIPGVGGCPGP